LKEGETVEAKITSVDRKNRRVSLSIKALEEQQESADIEEYARKSESGSSALANQLKEKLGN